MPPKILWIWLDFSWFSRIGRNLHSAKLHLTCLRSTSCEFCHGHYLVLPLHSRILVFIRAYSVESAEGAGRRAGLINPDSQEGVVVLNQTSPCRTWAELAITPGPRKGQTLRNGSRGTVADTLRWKQAAPSASWQKPRLQIEGRPGDADDHQTLFGRSVSLPECVPRWIPAVWPAGRSPRGCQCLVAVLKQLTKDSPDLPAPAASRAPRLASRCAAPRQDNLRLTVPPEADPISRTAVDPVLQAPGPTLLLWDNRPRPMRSSTVVTLMAAWLLRRSNRRPNGRRPCKLTYARGLEHTQMVTATSLEEVTIRL